MHRVTDAYVCVSGVHRQISLQRKQSCSGPEQTQTAGEAVSISSPDTHLD